MSGIRPHTFLTNYQPDHVEKLTVRLRNGLSSSKYRPAEYNRLQAIVDAKRLETALIGQKVHKTRRGARSTKESSVLLQHRQVWSREFPRLQKAEEKAADEIWDFLEQIRPSSWTDTSIFSLQDEESMLQTEREAFRLDTVEPIHQLRNDLSFRLRQVRNQNATSRPADWEHLRQQINAVKEQQEDTCSALLVESLALEEEIAALDLDKYLTASDHLADVVPEEVRDSDCPYPELKDSLLQAFHSLSVRHQMRLQSLQEQLQTTDKFCGWDKDDHLRFQLTLSQYAHDVPDHRALCMDMLQRLFPDRTRHELLEHERAWDRQRFTQAQLRAVTQQGQRDRAELLAKALVTLQEARNAHQEALELHADRKHQQDICLHLRDKVSGRCSSGEAQQEEVAKLEATIAARRQEEELDRLKREQEKEATLRSQQKEKVNSFHSKQQQRKKVLEQRDQERLSDLRRGDGGTARRDKERVQVRADMLQQRREEREAREAERQREEDERQKRLEALRNQVGVVADADPERMMADTQAWKSRHLNVEELQKPLYMLNTYTDSQIVSDPRIRVEQALREAGLQHSRYAREVLSVIRPPRPPRRDTESLPPAVITV
ncbi:coiled-coil domain-containing protein 148 [Lampetra planeri]